MKVAVVGATGVVGAALLQILQERELPIERVAAFASSEKPEGVSFNGTTLPVHAVSAERLAEFDAVFFASGEDQSATYAPAIARRGGIVIDNSATFRLQPDVPLVVPEINGETIEAHHRIFPVANCTAIVLCVALAPVREHAGLRAVQVATYQSVSGAGRAGLQELADGEAAVVGEYPEPRPAVFGAPIVRNVVPFVGTAAHDGYTSEETKVREETRKILNQPELRIAVTAVRVPVRYAHSEAVFFETEGTTSVAELSRAFETAAGVAYHAEGIVTPREVEGQDQVHVARLRAQDDSGTRFAMWVVGDQVRKGAATNGVQILELLLKRGWAGAAK